MKPTSSAPRSPGANKQSPPKMHGTTIFRLGTDTEDKSFVVKVQPLTDAPSVSYHCHELQVHDRGFTKTYYSTDVLEPDEHFEKKNLHGMVKLVKEQTSLEPPYKIVVMEACDGNLREFMNNVLPSMSKHQQITCIRQFLGDMIYAIHTLHRYKLVHGDIKPENIGYKYDKHKRKYLFVIFDFDGLTKEGSPVRFISPTYSVYTYVRRKAEPMHDNSAIVDTFLQICGILTKHNHYMFHFTNKQQLENLLGRRIEYPAAGKTVERILEATDVPNDIKKALTQAVRYIQKQNENKTVDETFINRIRTQFRIKR